MQIAAPAPDPLTRKKRKRGREKDTEGKAKRMCQESMNMTAEERYLSIVTNLC